MISRPLSDTLKKDYFQWPEFVLQAFYQLREAMAQAPMLAMSDISKPFVVKTYASGIGIGAVLEQKNYPIAFISQAFGPRAKALSVYERELLAITFCSSKWRHCLEQGLFFIKTDNESIKHCEDTIWEGCGE